MTSYELPRRDRGEGRRQRSQDVITLTLDAMSTSWWIAPDQLAALAAVLLSALALQLHRRRSRINAKLRSHGPDVILPPHLRSFVPVLGSALEMGRNVRRFVDKHSARFGHPVFTATIGFDHCLFIGDPDHVTMVHKHSKQLDDLALQKQFTRNVLGITDRREDEHMYSKDSEDTKEAVKMYQRYLFSRDELNKSVGLAQKALQGLLPQLAGDEDGWIQHGLLQMVRGCIFQASVAPLLSEHAASDETIETFMTFEKGIPLMFADAPGFLTREAQASLNQLVETIADPRFLEKGSDLMKARKALGFSDNVFNRTGVGLLFASVGNSIPGVFWCLAHILADPTAYEAIQAEVNGIVGSSEEGVFTIEELDRMLLLESAFTEALRLYMGAFTTREAVKDFIFDPKKPGQSKYLIEKGTRVMAFVATTKHYDEEVFVDAETFRFDRFAPVRGEDGKLRPRSFTKNGNSVVEPVRAFGGGAHLCPGRKFISYETRAFVALLLTKFDMRLVGDVPAIDYSSQGVGVSHPIGDAIVEIRVKG